MISFDVYYRQFCFSTVALTLLPFYSKKYGCVQFCISIDVINLLPVDSILHSVIIAGSQLGFIEYIINLLLEDGEDVLKKIINDQNHLQRVRFGSRIKICSCTCMYMCPRLIFLSNVSTTGMLFCMCYRLPFKVSCI